LIGNGRSNVNVNVNADSKASEQLAFLPMFLPNALGLARVA
jgi:hypothetical protein